MNSVARSIFVGLAAFGAGVVGMLLDRAIPVDVLAEAKGPITAMVGLVGQLLALVLGLLVSAAYNAFTKQQSDTYSLAPLAIRIDRAHEQYGPEGIVGRAHLRAAVMRTRARFFGDDGRGPRPFTHDEMKATFAAQDDYFEGLAPTTEWQRRSLMNAWDLARKYQDTQMLMANQLASPFPPHVLNIVVYWAGALFLGNGLVSTPNAITVIVFLAGAISIAVAIFLILELSNPYTGIIRLSSAGLDRLLSALDDAPAKAVELEPSPISRNA